jgi:hypothetical protein
VAVLIQRGKGEIVMNEKECDCGLTIVELLNAEVIPSRTAGKVSFSRTRPPLAWEQKEMNRGTGADG